MSRLGARFFLENMKKAEKSLLVDNLASELKDAKGIVLVNFAGMGVKPQQELKRRLKEAGSKMFVVKNTLLSRALELAHVGTKEIEPAVLTGQTAIIVAQADPIAPISVLGKFAKEFEVPQMKVGIIEGAFQDTESLAKIAALPDKDALLGQVLGSLVSSMYQLIGILNSPMQGLVYTLSAKAQ